MLRVRLHGTKHQLWIHAVSNTARLQLKSYTQEKSFAHLPIIDLKPILTTEQSNDDRLMAKRTTAVQLLHILKTKGFFYVKNSPLDENTIEETINCAKQFFESSAEEKLKVASSEDNRFGYYRFHGIGIGEESVRDLIEAYLICKETANRRALKMKYYEKLGTPLHERNDRWNFWANRWPQNNPPLFKEIVLNYWNKCVQTSDIILRLIALSLNLPEDYFITLHDQHDCTLEIKRYHSFSPQKVNNDESGYITLKGGVKIKRPQFAYPQMEPTRDYVNNVSVSSSVKNDGAVVRMKPHTDMSSITLLTQNETGGLQMYADDAWIAIPKIPNCIFVNTGNVFHRWTNGLFKEALHRVVWDPNTQTHSDRYSIVYFCWPNWEVDVAPLNLASHGKPKQHQTDSTVLFGDIVPFL
jgi:isopenicillin N synthase-like dioxygenase